MIPSPEGFSNFMQGGLGVAPSQIHRHLARECNIRGAPFTGHIRYSNIKMFGHLLLNLINSDPLLGFSPQNIPKKLFYRFAGNLSATQRRLWAGTRMVSRIRVQVWGHYREVLTPEVGKTWFKIGVSFAAVK
jgi:hypothetical protein